MIDVQVLLTVVVGVIALIVSGVTFGRTLRHDSHITKVMEVILTTALFIIGLMATHAILNGESLQWYLFATAAPLFAAIALLSNRNSGDDIDQTHGLEDHP